MQGTLIPASSRILCRISDLIAEFIPFPIINIFIALSGSESLINPGSVIFAANLGLAFVLANQAFAFK